MAKTRILSLFQHVAPRPILRHTMGSPCPLQKLIAHACFVMIQYEGRRQGCKKVNNVSLDNKCFSSLILRQDITTFCYARVIKMKFY